jgi:hypothetical protein
MLRYSSCIQLAAVLLLALSAQLVLSTYTTAYFYYAICLLALGDSSEVATSSSDDPAPPLISPYSSYDNYEGKDDSGSYGSDLQDDNSEDLDSSEPTQPTPPASTPELDLPNPQPLPSTPLPLPPTDAPKPSPPAQGAVSFSMKLLLVGTSSTDTYFLSAKLTLDSVGATYDTVFVGTIPELVGANGGASNIFISKTPRF